MPPNPGFFSQTRAGGQAAQTKSPRLLCLHGEEGTLACRVHDPSYTKMLPQRSPWGRSKYALLSEEKMGNLTAVRGVPGKSMIGPADYFCDLERSDQYFISIDISPEGIPAFQQYPLTRQHGDSSLSLEKLVDEQLTKVKAQWFSGSNKEVLRQKMVEYRNQENPVLSESLFPNSGILEIDAPKEIKLPTFDPRGVDLSAFKARIVANDAPFQITEERLHVDDEYCAVSYHYDPGYAERQVKHGGGLFLEFHQFAQTITPLHRDSKGFVTLAKWDEAHIQLELIAIQIPFGYTLIIDKNGIHGDTNLNGLFMMCMTSDHISMATADTVFLKHVVDKDNITISLDNIPEQEAIQRSHRPLDPLVFYKENKVDSFSHFKQRTQDMEVIFSPFNLGYWEVKQDIISTVSFFVLAGASLLAAIFLVDTMLILSLGLFSASVALAGVGLFRVLPSASIENSLLLDNALAI